MISLSNRALSALYSVIPQLKASKDQRLFAYKDAPFAVVRYIEKGADFEKEKYARAMNKPSGVHQGSYLLRNVAKLIGTGTSSSYYVCTISDIIAIIPWIQRMCDSLLEKYYQNFAFGAHLRSMSRLQTKNASYLTFEDFSLLVSLLDLLIEFAPIHYCTRDDYYRADSGSGERLLSSPLEQLLIMERESDRYNKYDTTVASNFLMSSLCVRHREKMSTVNWTGYSVPLKLPVINTFFWDVNGFSLGMLQSRILMLSTPTGGNPAWNPGSFYYGLKRITGSAPFNTTSCPMLNKELASCTSVDDLSFMRIRRALVLLSALSFNGQFYLSANYGTPPKTLEPLYIRKSCPRRGCFVRINNYYVQIPSFVVDNSSSSFTKDEDCSFSQSPLPRFYSGNADLAKSEKGYGCYARNSTEGYDYKGHRYFKSAYQKFVDSSARPIVSLLSKRDWKIANDLKDPKFPLVINGIEHEWPNGGSKALAYLFVNNIADRRLDNEFNQKQTLMTVMWACDAPASSFGGLVHSIFLQWYGTLVKLLPQWFLSIADKLQYDPQFAICKYYTTEPNFNAALTRQDFFKYVADDAIHFLKLSNSETEIANILMQSGPPAEAFLPGSFIASASVVYGETGITDSDLLAAIPSKPAFISAQFDSADIPESIHIPGAYDVYESDVDDDLDDLTASSSSGGRNLILDRLNWRIIFNQRKS